MFRARRLPNLLARVTPIDGATARSSPAFPDKPGLKFIADHGRDARQVDSPVENRHLSNINKIKQLLLTTHFNFCFIGF
jgi:ethanolamine ammonia-lyase small subunit